MTVARTGLRQFLSQPDETVEALFDGGRAARPLQVLIDAVVFEELHTATDIAPMMLAGLLEHEGVETSQYREQGPPPDAERLPPDGFARGDEAIGWTALTPTSESMPNYLVTKTTRSGFSQSAVFEDELWAARSVLQMEGRSSAVDVDARFVVVAQRTSADVLITRRESLLQTELEDRGACRFVSPRDAIALVALYLRSAGHYYYLRGGIYSGVADASTFYNMAAEHLIPSLRSFIDRGVDTVSTPRLITVQRRVRGLLRARDQVAILCSVPASTVSADAIEAEFSQAILNMVALHDVLARVTNELMQPREPEPHKIKWQRDHWRGRAIREFPCLAALWADGGSARELNSALRTVRNEIHDVAPIVAPYSTRWGSPQVGLGFLEAVALKVEKPLERLDAGADRGVAARLKDGMVISPLVFLEFVFPWMMHTVHGTLTALSDRLPEAEPAETKPGFRPEAVSESLRLMLHVRTIAREM